MDGENNFWDGVQSDAESSTVPPENVSLEASGSNETTMPISASTPEGSPKDVTDDFIPHEPREIVTSVLSHTIIAVIAGAMLIGGPATGLVDEFFNIFPMECDGELVESDDGTYLCQTDDFQTDDLMLEVFDENGQEIVDATRQMAGFAIMVSMGLLYILGVYAAYTKKTHLAHLGSENTIVLNSSWFNKPAKEKGRIHLMPTSYLREYITRSTDSEGKTTTYTNYKICTPDQPSLSVPSGFSRRKLVEFTGLPVRRD